MERDRTRQINIELDEWAKREFDAVMADWHWKPDERVGRRIVIQTLIHREFKSRNLKLLEE